MMPAPGLATGSDGTEMLAVFDLARTHSVPVSRSTNQKHRPSTVAPFQSVCDEVLQAHSVMPVFSPVTVLK